MMTRDKTTDRLLVHGLEFKGHHGVYEVERIEGNRFRVDVSVELDTRPAGGSDALNDTVDYRVVADAILAVGLGPSHHLIESMAESMAALIFERAAPVVAVELTLRKFASGVPGDPEWVGVQIRRARGQR